MDADCNLVFRISVFYLIYIYILYGQHLDEGGENTGNPLPDALKYTDT